MFKKWWWIIKFPLEVVTVHSISIEYNQWFLHINKHQTYTSMQPIGLSKTGKIEWGERKKNIRYILEQRSSIKMIHELSHENSVFILPMISCLANANISFIVVRNEITTLELLCWYKRICKHKWLLKFAPSSGCTLLITLSISNMNSSIIVSKIFKRYTFEL